MTGIAPIKPEFIFVRQSSVANSSSSDQISSKSIVESPNEIPVSTTGENSTKIVDSNNDRKRKDDKKKSRGQNKKRPKPQRPNNDERLCVSVAEGRICPYGDQCRFMHDLKAFWESKPPDIADRCPNFETFGKCRYNFSCRFAGAHVDTTTWQNIENQEKLASIKNKSDKDEINKLDRDMLNKLRRRQYDFKRSYEICGHKFKVENGSEPDVLGAVSEKPAVDSPNVDMLFDKEKRISPPISWTGRRYLAPLTTVGNLPFRRICVEFGAEITCGEMAMGFEILQGHASEWALLKRHSSEKIFGVQLCGNYPDVMTKCAQVITDQLDVDFIDINMGCPIDLVCDRGAGCSLMNRQNKAEQILRTMRKIMPENVALTVKMRTGYHENKNVAHLLAPKLADAGVSLFTVHGRSKEARYTKLPDWDYICECAKAAAPLPCYGCGDILSFEDYYQRLDQLNEANHIDGIPSIGGVMIARGGLIKPWIFTEIEERRHWDISSSERMEILKRYVNYGLEHWGSDQQGVSITRRFLLEWLSFLHRYIPVGILERIPQRINERPPSFFGRDDLETLMASSNCSDWIKISEMLLGPVEPGFLFLPKHKANSY